LSAFASRKANDSPSSSPTQRRSANWVFRQSKGWCARASCGRSLRWQAFLSPPWRKVSRSLAPGPRQSRHVVTAP